MTKANTAEVGCMGVLVADTFCGPMRELPREGHLLAVDSMLSQAGGCAANVAMNLVKQGVRADVCGCLGTDGGAQMVRADLEHGGVGCAPLVYTEREATSKTVILIVEGEDRRYIHMFGANKELTVAHISRDWLKNLKVFYIGGLFALPRIETTELCELLQYCRAHGVKSVVDVIIPQDFSEFSALNALLPLVDYFLPNADEAKQITGSVDPLQQLRALRDAGASTAVITLGGGGTAAMRGDEYWLCGTYEANVIDPSGAGDAFAAGIVTGITRGWDMPAMLRFASALGASATTAIGTTAGVFTAVEAENFIAARTLEMQSGTL